MLLLVAADHPARGALGVRDDPWAMASRHDLLERLVTAVSRRRTPRTVPSVAPADRDGLVSKPREVFTG